MRVVDRNLAEIRAQVRGTERYDVALVFCTKAVEVSPRHLAARLLLARIYDRGLDNFEAAVAGYKKVIALAGYDGSNEHCMAAREALDQLVSRSELLPARS